MLDVGRFNSAEPTMNARVEPRFELMHTKCKGTNEGRKRVGCRKIQLCRTNYERSSRTQIRTNTHEMQRN